MHAPDFNPGRAWRPPACRGSKNSADPEGTIGAIRCLCLRPPGHGAVVTTSPGFQSGACMARDFDPLQTRQLLSRSTARQPGAQDIEINGIGVRFSGDEGIRNATAYRGSRRGVRLAVEFGKAHPLLATTLATRRGVSHHLRRPSQPRPRRTPRRSGGVSRGRYRTRRRRTPSPGQTRAEVRAEPA